MYGPEGNNKFCFPESPDVSRDEVEGNFKTREGLLLVTDVWTICGGAIFRVKW